MTQRSDDERPRRQEGHPHDVWTVANVITVLRLLIIPFFFSVIISDRSNVLAFALFAAAASTDFLDGQIARRTGTVTAIGKVIDPLVDRLLIAAGVLGLYLIDRIPIWLVIALLLRDAYLLGGAFLLERMGSRLPVTAVGKATTAVLLVGFSLLILGWPTVEIGGVGYYLGALIIYVGFTLSMLSAIHYTVLFTRVAARRRAT